MNSHPSALSRYLFKAVGLMALAGLAFILASALWSWRASRLWTLTYRLRPQQGAVAPGDLERTARVVARRLGLLARDFHLGRISARALPPDRVEVRFKARSAPDIPLAWATMAGRVEFRLLYPHDPPPEELLPDTYETKVYRAQRFILSRPGDLETVLHSYVVERQPALVCNGVAEATIETTGMHKLAVLTLRLPPQDADAFAALTALNVGRRMALLIDGEMFVPPREIEGPITGGAVQVSGYFQLPPLRKLVKMLNTGPLPGRLEEIARTAE